MAAVGIGLLVSAIAATMQQAMLYSFVIMMPFALLVRPDDAYQQHAGFPAGSHFGQSPALRHRYRPARVPGRGGAAAVDGGYLAIRSDRRSDAAHGRMALPEPAHVAVLAGMLGRWHWRLVRQCLVRSDHTGGRAASATQCSLSPFIDWIAAVRLLAIAGARCWAFSLETARSLGACRRRSRRRSRCSSPASRAPAGRTTPARPAARDSLAVAEAEPAAAEGLVELNQVKRDIAAIVASWSWRLTSVVCVWKTRLKSVTPPRIAASPVRPNVAASTDGFSSWAACCWACKKPTSASSTSRPAVSTLCWY